MIYFIHSIRLLCYSAHRIQFTIKVTCSTASAFDVVFGIMSHVTVKFAPTVWAAGSRKRFNHEDLFVFRAIRDDSDKAVLFNGIILFGHFKRLIITFSFVHFTPLVCCCRPFQPWQRIWPCLSSCTTYVQILLHAVVITLSTSVLDLTSHLKYTVFVSRWVERCSTFFSSAYSHSQFHLTRVIEVCIFSSFVTAFEYTLTASTSIPSFDVISYTFLLSILVLPVVVLQDVVSTMFAPKFVEELFRPERVYSSSITRQIFDRLGKFADAAILCLTLIID